MAANARTINAGQSCIAENASSRYIKKLLQSSRNTLRPASYLELKVGDPMDESTDIGPLAKSDILNSLKKQLKDALAKGARVVQAEHSFKKVFSLPHVQFIIRQRK